MQDPPLYAETWIRDGGTRGGDNFDRMAEAWLDDFEERGVTAVGFGYVTNRMLGFDDLDPRRKVLIDAVYDSL